jgi:hypothetical protein
MITTSNVTTSVSTIYTSAGETALAVAYFCNYSTSPAQISVHLVPNGQTANVLNKIYSNVSVTAGDTLVVETEKVVFANGDTIQANASANNTFNAVLSYVGA